MWGTDVTFGFDSAVGIATEAIDRLHTTANSHKRVMVIEVMGHNAGWIALYSGLAAGGDVVLLPENKIDMNVVAKTLMERSTKGKQYSIVVVGEGIAKPKNQTAASFVGSKIQKLTGLETRETILGYIQRGGTPSPQDRILATRYGAHAAELIHRGEFGTMVSIRDNAVTSVPLSEVAGKLHLVDTHHYMIEQARSVITSYSIHYTKLYDMSAHEQETLAYNIIVLTQGFINGSVAGAKDYKTLFLSFLEAYKNIDSIVLRKNLSAFLNDIMPVADQYGIKMCIHPDDPPFPVLGLPRIVSTQSDLEWRNNFV